MAGVRAETGYAKINLALHVRRREADGYHAIETLFAFLDAGDALTLKPDVETTLVVTGPFANALTQAGGGPNLVLAAAAAFRQNFGGTGGAFRLDKRLPVASGIGGGSADAGAALRLLAAAQGLAVDDAALLAIAAGLGADVPACLLSRTLRGEGRGTEMRPVADGGLAGMPVLLVNPGVALATGPVFARWDGIDRGPLGKGHPLAAAAAGRNDLEPPARALAPAIGELLGLMADAGGARLVRMSGSGATCFALFDDPARRDAMAKRIAATRPTWWRLATRLR